MTVFGGLQYVHEEDVELVVERFNTDDGIWRATIHFHRSQSEQSHHEFQYR